MNKFKVVVYAISKNEEKFVERWYNSMKEADEIYVLDTGSEDNTVKLLKKYGINVNIKKYKTWRFDVARNDSLELVPYDADICVCTDLDEVFVKGWRQKLEDNYIKNRRVYYTFNWHLTDGVPDGTFLLNKIHPRNNYKWIHPVHEILTCLSNEEYVNISDIVLNHFPDNEKSRDDYLNLLELSVKESPYDDRNMHYLGREYLYYGMYAKCIKTLKKHLKLESAVWNIERSASMRYIGRSYDFLNNIDEAIKWYKKAIKEAPNIRDAYVELGMLYYNSANYLESIKLLISALSIQKRELHYVSEIFCYDSTIDDILSICYFHLGLNDLALFHVNKALILNSKNERLQNNKKLIEATFL